MTGERTLAHVGILLLFACVAIGLHVTTLPHDAAGERCELTQQWWTGDVYDWHELAFDRDGRGTWMFGDRHGEIDTIDFTWSRRGDDRMIVRSRGERRDVRYSIRSFADGTCTLRFDRSPVGDAPTELSGQVSQ